MLQMFTRENKKNSLKLPLESLNISMHAAYFSINILYNEKIISYMIFMSTKNCFY